MSGKLLDLVASNIFGAIGVAIVGWLFNKYVDQLSERLSEYKQASNERIADLANRITTIEAKYRDVLDIVLDKFSKWEDRILGLIAKMGTVTPQELQNDIDQFREDAVNDLATMKLKVERVSSEVQRLANEPSDELQKNLILGKLDEVKLSFDHRIKFLEENNSRQIKALTAMNQKQKEHEFKLENLIAIRRGKNE